MAAKSTGFTNPEGAVKMAAAYLQRMIPQAQKIMLEEIETEGSHWLVTLSYVHDDLGIAYLGRKEYKTFKLDAKTGEVIAMKIKMMK